MKHDIINEEIRETLSLYALGLLEEEEARAVEAHLTEGCRVCAREVEGFAAVVSHLGFGVAHSAPSFKVRDQLLRQVSEQSESET